MHAPTSGFSSLVFAPASGRGDTETPPTAMRLGTARGGRPRRSNDARSPRSPAWGERMRRGESFFRGGFKGNQIGQGDRRFQLLFPFSRVAFWVPNYL